MSEVIEAHGVNGQVTFDGSVVTIRREGLLGRVAHGRGEKTIPLNQIAGVQLKPVGALTRGYIQFTVPGEISSRTSKGGRTTDAAADENAVLIGKKQENAFLALRDAIVAAISNPV